MGNLIASGIVAPVDFMRFSVAYIVLALVPGFAVATLTRPKSDLMERFATSIPCAYALVAVSGLTSALLRLPFGLPVFSCIAIPVTLAGVYCAWHSYRQGCHTSIDRWWLLPLGVALVQLAIACRIFTTYTVPVGPDSIVHAAYTNLIFKTHTFPLTLVSSHLGANDGPFYPAAFHALDALVLAVAPMPAYRVVFMSVVLLAMFFPLGLFSYVRAATGSTYLSGLAVLTSLAFEPLPLFVLAQGLYPMIVALLFVPALALALRDGLGSNDRRSLILAGVLGIGLLYVHPTEAVAVGLLSISIVLEVLEGKRMWIRAATKAIMLAGVWTLAAVPALPAVHSAMKYISSSAGYVAQGTPKQTSPHLGAILATYITWIYGRNVSYFLLIAVLAGCVWCLWHRRFLGIVVAQATMLMLFADVNGLKLLHHFHMLSFHWTDPERLAPAHYWVVLPLAAVGIRFFLDSIRRLLPSWSLSFTFLAASPAFLIGLILPLAVSTGRVSAYSSARNVAAPADLGSLLWLTRHAPATSVVVNDGDMTHSSAIEGGIDAGMWLPATLGPQPLFGRGSIGIGTVSDRLYLVQHIGDNPLPHRATQLIKQHRVLYVLYGARVAPQTIRHLSLKRLLGDPQLHLVYASTEQCLHARNFTSRVCPPSDSYVFALNR